MLCQHVEMKHAVALLLGAQQTELTYDSQTSDADIEANHVHLPGVLTQGLPRNIRSELHLTFDTLSLGLLLTTGKASADMRAGD